MYIKHVFSWVLYYHGTHIVQKVRTANRNIPFYNNMKITTMQFPNLEIFTFQEWESKEIASYVTYTILLISLTFNIFIFCYIGELVTEQVTSGNSYYQMISLHFL